VPPSLPLVWMTVEREDKHITISARDENTGETFLLVFTLPGAENLSAAIRSLRKTAPKDADVFDFGTRCRIEHTKKSEVA
jgi:hypothetical protein